LLFTGFVRGALLKSTDNLIRKNSESKNEASEHKLAAFLIYCCKRVINVNMLRVSSLKVKNVKLWFGLLTALVVILFASRVWLIPEHFSTDPDEGWNAFQAARALGGGALYPSPYALTGNNYTPLSFYLVGWFGRMVGDPIVAGRIASLIAVLAVAGNIFVIVGRFSLNKSASIISVLLFLGFNATLFRRYLCMDDPQWLSLAIMTSGVAILLPIQVNTSPTKGRVIASVILMILGGLLKQNSITFPLVTTVWLTLHHRHLLSIWIGVSAAAILISAALCFWAYGENFFVDVFLAERQYSWSRMLIKSAPIVATLIPMLLISGKLMKDRMFDSRLDFIILAVVISVLVGIIQRSGQGVDYNAHFESLISLCLSVGIVFALHGIALEKNLSLRRIVLLMVPFSVMVPLGLNAEVNEIIIQQATETSWENMENHIESTPGPVACENLALCYWAGKGFEIDFFTYGQRALIQHNTSTLQNALISKRFSAIEITSVSDRTRSPNDLSDPIPSIIDKYYSTVIIRDQGQILLAPNSGSTLADWMPAPRASPQTPAPSRASHRLTYADASRGNNE
jgi:hypothetical protein